MNTMILGGGEIIWESVVRIIGTISDHARSLHGLTDPELSSAAITDGVFFEIQDGDTNWHIVSASAASITRRDTGIAFVSGTWVKMRFVVNAAKTSIQAFMDGVSVGAPITTNIPSVTVSPTYKTDSKSGGLATPFQTDYMALLQTLTTPR